MYKATYHSKHGAIQESYHVFLQEGLHRWLGTNPKANSVRIFEMGFGTGLNAYLTYLDQRSTRQIQYFALEKHPLDLFWIKKLNFHELIDSSNQQEFLEFHIAEWNSCLSINLFDLHKIKGDIFDVDIPKQLDLIYYDAFAPSSQPELWKKPVLSRILVELKPGGILVTYCSQGAFRRTLAELGMNVIKVPGPPGKREMVVATKDLGMRKRE